MVVVEWCSRYQVLYALVDALPPSGKWTRHTRSLWMNALTASLDYCTTTVEPTSQPPALEENPRPAIGAGQWTAWGPRPTEEGTHCIMAMEHRYNRIKADDGSLVWECLHCKERMQAAWPVPATDGREG